jgi:hypothetical protein
VQSHNPSSVIKHNFLGTRELNWLDFNSFDPILPSESDTIDANLANFITIPDSRRLSDSWKANIHRFEHRRQAHQIINEDINRII